MIPYQSFGIKFPNLNVSLTYNMQIDDNQENIRKLIFDMDDLTLNKAFTRLNINRTSNDILYNKENLYNIILHKSRRLISGHISMSVSISEIKSMSICLHSAKTKKDLLMDFLNRIETILKSLLDDQNKASAYSDFNNVYEDNKLLKVLNNIFGKKNVFANEEGKSKIKLSGFNSEVTTIEDRYEQKRVDLKLKRKLEDIDICFSRMVEDLAQARERAKEDLIKNSKDNAK